MCLMIGAMQEEGLKKCKRKRRKFKKSSRIFAVQSRIRTERLILLRKDKFANKNTALLSREKLGIRNLQSIQLNMLYL